MYKIVHFYFPFFVHSYLILSLTCDYSRMDKSQVKILFLECPNQKSLTLKISFLSNIQLLFRLKTCLQVKINLKRFLEKFNQNIQGGFLFRLALYVPQLSVCEGYFSSTLSAKLITFERVTPLGITSPPLSRTKSSKEYHQKVLAR